LTIAIYPGAFDPITNGHLDIATRASRLFEKIVIGVYDTPADKNIMFTTEERVDMVKKSIAGLPNVEVRAFNSLTVDFAREVGANSIVRGLRVATDFEREFEMALMNKKLYPDCELVCLMSNQQYQFLSSSLLKEVAGLDGNINGLVPEAVASALKEKYGGKT